jgi:hypothetical protein
LIDRAGRSATTVQLRSGLDEIRQIVGFDTVDSDELETRLQAIPSPINGV